MDKHQVKKSYLFMFIVLLIFFLLMALVFGKILSRFGLKLISCGLILALLGLLVSAYRYECQQFEKRDDLTRLRNFGASINPHSPAGKIIFLLALIIIIAIFAVLLFAS